MLLSDRERGRRPAADVRGMTWLAGGTFRMGSEAFYPEEAPVREAVVDGFWIDTRPVTNRDFGAFVAATGYVTLAERAPDPADYPGVPPEALVPGALVFAPDLSQTVYRGIADWWEYRPGATWQLPEGPGRGVVAHPDHPVVQVAWEDARAYADWVGKRLPTEAEWEFAARGGLDGADYAWGDRMRPDGLVMANTFEGRFPVGLPGKRPGTSAVGCYPPNGFGLLDMIGNVWEWTADFYAPPGAPAGCCAQSEADARTESRDPAQPDIEIPRKVVKGGSFLCSPDYCLRFRPAARQPQMIDTAAGHIGFRCVSGAGPGAVR